MFKAEWPIDIWTWWTSRAGTSFGDRGHFLPWFSRDKINYRKMIKKWNFLPFPLVFRQTEVIIKKVKTSDIFGPWPIDFWKTWLMTKKLRWSENFCGILWKTCGFRQSCSWWL